jgi:ABC-2 type transport system ATP-binding protein
LKKRFGASRVSLFGDRLHVVTEKEDQKREAVAALDQAGVHIVASKPVPFSLEDVFISLIESRRSEIPL